MSGKMSSYSHLLVIVINNPHHCTVVKPIRAHSLKGDVEGCECLLFPLRIDWPHVESSHPRPAGSSFHLHHTANSQLKDLRYYSYI